MTALGMEPEPGMLAPTMTSLEAHIHSVNVGGRRTVEWAGRSVETGIWKSPIDGPVPVRGVNLKGDDQADRRVHGGPDKAVYAYAAEDYEWWSRRLDREIAPATFGENLTTTGLDLGQSLVGERWAVGTTLLEVCQPRLPCFKLGIRMDDPTFPDAFERETRLGVYLRIIEEGEVQAGDPIEMARRPDHGLTAYDIARAYPHGDAETIQRILAVDSVPEGWKTWAERARGRSGL